MAKYTIDFQPVGRRVECSEQETVLDCARRSGIGINSICGGVGTCNACRVQIVSGKISKPTDIESGVFSPEELKAGWRLACQTNIPGDCRIYIPPESMTTPQRLQVEGLEISVIPKPTVATYDVQIDAPSLSDLRADAERLLKSLNHQYNLRCRQIDQSVLHTLSPQLRSEQWHCQIAVRGNEIIYVNKAGSRCLGLAVDIGTTKIAGYLLDLSNGKVLVSRGLMNPQISYGEDVISRLTQSMISEESGKQLQSLLVESLNQMAAGMCSEVGAKVTDIVEAVAVGNTAMHHLFLGLPVRQLAVSPFVPVIASALDIKARELNLKFAPGVYVHLLPNIAGFVGADHVAALLSTGMRETKDTSLLIDIGTNTEISLVKKGRITAVSCASGPAFEGGHIKYGMRAASGAIERLRIEGNAVHFQTIDNVPPVGICGSGILDAMAQLYLAGIIDKTGKMTDNYPRIRNGQKQREFVLAENPEIVVTQQDIRELQLAKAAIRTGIQALLNAHHCTDDDVRQVIIAGAFGSYIDVSSAIAIGMLPSLPLDRFHQVGNAAGAGAKLSLISLSQRNLAQKIAENVHYLELAGTPDFMRLFTEANYLGRYRLEDSRRRYLD